MKENKAISKIFDILEWIVTAGLLLLIILVGVQKFSEAGNFFGYRIYIVASGSMIPTYEIGDTLLVKEVPMEEFKVKDAVTYKGDTGGVDGIVITHQIQKIEKDEKGQYLFHTKGIANNIEDPIVYEKQVLGKVTHKFLVLSILGRIITNRLLLLLGIMLPMAFLVAVEIIKIVYKKDDDEYDKLLDVESDEEDAKKKENNKKEKVKEEVETPGETEEKSDEKQEVKEENKDDLEDKNEERALIEELIKEVKKVKKTNEKLKGKLYGKQYPKQNNKTSGKTNEKVNNKKNNNQGTTAKGKNYYKNNKKK